MRLPTRRADKNPRLAPDYHLTAEKLQKHQTSLKNLLQARPALAKQVALLSEDGDFSENAGYQAAKGKLRSLNNKINKIEDLIKKAVIIKQEKKDYVSVGSSVVLESRGVIKKYLILGSQESDPAQGVISYLSPLGAELIGKKEGEIVEIREKSYKIKEIN